MYDQIASGYDELHAHEQRRKLAKLLAHITLPAYANVLDVGCATAHLHEFFGKQEYLVVDPCQQLLDHAPPGVATLCVPGEDLPLATDSYELTLSLTALHNYDDPLAGVQQLARVTQHTALIGVLKKASNHDDILRHIKEHFLIRHEISDQHDTLFVAIPRNS